MISKIYGFLGSFLIGVGCSGLISYTAYTFPQARRWAFSLLIITAFFFLLAGIVDEQVAAWLGIPYRAYLACIISLFLILTIGGLIQWQ